MTWTTHHRRGDVLRAVLAAAADRRDGLLPLDVDGVSSTFESELALVGALQLKWHTRLAGQIERHLVAQPMDLDAAVIAAWCAVDAELPGVRAIIDHYREHPVDDDMATALSRATLKEQVFLAAMAGRGGLDDVAAAPVGAHLEEQARAASHQLRVLGVPAAGSAGPTGQSDPTSPGRVSLLERLRAVLAA